MAWADRFYTEEASIQNFYGSEGVGTQKNADGTYTVLEPRYGMSADTCAWVSSLRDFGPKYVSDSFNEKILYAGENGDAAKLALDASMKQYAVPAYPNVSYTVEQLDDLRTLYTDINAYVSTYQASWVTEGGVEEQWNDYINTLNRMGLDKFLKIQTDAYNTYFSNK